MEYRNPRYNRWGSIDVEINHPDSGWIPFTASPDDPERYGRDIYEQLRREDVAAYEPSA